MKSFCLNLETAEREVWNIFFLYYEKDRFVKLLRLRGY